VQQEPLRIPFSDWHIGPSDLGLTGDFFDDYSTRFVKKEFATDQRDDLDAKAKAA
jgi:hypothetical protein